MKHKRFLSTVAATVLVASTMVMPVMAEDGGGFDVTVTTKTPVIRVVVPTTMEIAVNQFEMGDAGSQIYSNAFEMENKSEIPVKMKITSTATIPATTTLVATKAAATGSENSGDAWLAVAAQTSAGKYIEESGKTINDLTEESANVTTFSDKKAEQTYYLNTSSTMQYKLLNANESAADIQYAQFYELIPKTFTASSEDAELKALLKNKDVYTIATSSIADGAAVTKVQESDTWANTNTYYEVAQTATAKADIVTTKLYVYGDGVTDAAGKAAFRYIGKLSGNRETWTETDLSKISVAYKIVGVQQTDYDALAAQTGVLTYGLYKAPTPPTPPSASTTASSITPGGAAVEFTVPAGVTVSKVEKTKADGTYNELPASYYKWEDITGGKKLTLDSSFTGSYGAGKKIKITFSSGDPIELNVQ